MPAHKIGKLWKGMRVELDAWVKVDVVQQNKFQQKEKGEELVYNDQVEFVKKHAPEYLKSVRHVSKIDGDGVGYDMI